MSLLKLKEVKAKLSEKAQKGKELSENEPKKKPVFKHKIELVDLFNGILMAAFVGALIAAIVTANIGLYIFALLLLVGTLLYTFLYKKGIEQIKKHKAIKKQNAENEEWNATAYVKLYKEYDEKRQHIQDEYDRILEKEISVVVKECIALAIQRQKTLSDEISNLATALADEKFSIYSIREYSIEKLESLAEYLGTGRASDYKEAINLYLQEQSERERHNDMLRMEERRAEEERIHNAQMERAARDAAYHAEETAKSTKRQEELKRQELLSKCKTCKNACYGNIEHCRGYVRK